MTKVTDIIYKHISKNVSTAYMFSGGSIMSLINNFHNKNNYNKIKYFIPSHEASAGFCSIGHNKSLNKCDSVIITTSGPGITNILTPLTDAYSDMVPFLVISGDVSTDMMGKHAFQEAPAIELTKPITYWNYSLLNPNEIHDVMNYAFSLVNNNKQVHINIPKDILNKSINENENLYINKKSIDTIYNYDINNIINIANIINNSYKPILYVGKGCIDSSELIDQLSLKGNIPVTTTLHGLGIFNEKNYNSLKMVGMHGSIRANVAIQNSDCIICVGARFDDRTVGNIQKYAPNAKYIIHINNDKSVFNKVILKSINIHGKSKQILSLLINYIDTKNNYDWFNFLQKYPINFPFNPEKLKQQHILVILNEELNKLKEIKKDTIITTGVGNHQMYAAQLITHMYPNRFITSGSLGTMGSSNSMAIGAKIANPDKIVISIDGDQSFNMMNDLKMIMNYNIGIKIIIMNDSKQSMVNIWEKLFFDNNIVATESINPNYDLLAKAYNINCITIDKNMTFDDIRLNIIKFIKYDNNEPIILNCIVESDFCLPLVPPGNALDDMITYDNINNYIINKSAAPS